MKKIVIIIVIVFISSIAMLLGVKYSKNNQENRFDRSFNEPILKIKASIAFQNSAFSLSGNTDSTFFVHYYKDINSGFLLSFGLNNVDTLQFNYPLTFSKDVKRVYKNISGDTIYTINPFGEILVFHDKHRSNYAIPGLLTNRFEVISPTSLVTRVIKYVDRNPVRKLVKIKLSDPAKVINTYEYPKIPGGFFANDGVLHYDKKTHRVLYMYFYRGEFISLDTNLNLLYHAKTIDTVNNPRIITRVVNKKTDLNKPIKTLITTKPPAFVNINLTSDGEFVYILSKLKASNESQETFDKNQVIDVYEIKTGKYRYSFHVPRYKNFKFRQFLKQGQSFIALYDKYIVNYEFSL